MSLKGIFPIDKWDMKTSTLLQDLPQEEWNKLTAHMHEEKVDKGQVIFREGSFPTGIFLIMNGKVKKYKLDKDAQEQILYVANTGELIGYHALLAEERYSDSAAALEETRIAFFPKEDFLEVLNHSKVLAHRLLKLLSHEFSVFNNSLALFAQRTVRERFAMQLVLMREKYKQDFVPGMDVEINMSREDLANLVGTARENIVRILKEFKQEGIVETKGRKILIKDINKLLQVTNH